MDAPRQRRESLWMLTFGPLIWSVHFLLSYLTAAIYCAKFWRPGQDPRTAIQLSVGTYTVVGLAGIVLILVRGYRQHRFGGPSSIPHQDPTAADRHRFLGFATMLLGGLSFVATVYTALAAAFVAECG